MAINLYLKSDGLYDAGDNKIESYVVYHTGPKFPVTLTFNKNLELSINFYGSGKEGCRKVTNDDGSISYKPTGSYFYNGHIGYKITDGDDRITTEDTSSFGFGFQYDDDGNVKRTYGTLKGTSPNRISSSDITLTSDLSYRSFPFTIDLLCDLCVDKPNGKLDSTDLFKDTTGDHTVFIINDARHTHEIEPSAPTINSTTGTSITVNTSGWEEIKIDNGSWINITGSTYTFTGLTQGTEYTITCRKICNDCPDSIIYEKSIKATTWNISGSLSNQTSKNLKFQASHIAGTGGNVNTNIVCELYKKVDNTLIGTKETNSGNTNILFTNLTHNTEYYCKIYTKGITDNSKTINASTYKLLLVNTGIVEEHQHSLITSWQAKVNNINTDKDAIDNTDFIFSSLSTKAIKKSPYQSSEVKEGTNGVTTGVYNTDKKVYSNNLTWYYCEYEVTATISDGYNTASATIIAHTTFPYSWIYLDGSKKWVRIIPYIYTDEVTGKKEWVPAPAFNCDGTKFIESNGE